MKGNEKTGGLLFATKMAIGGAIGYEIFVYLGPAYVVGGPSIVSAIILAGLLNLLTMLSYCELSGILPREGGEYTYARAAFGDIVGFMTGCVRWLSSMIGGALAARTFASLFLMIAGPSLIAGTQTEILTAIISAIIVLALSASSTRGHKRIGTFIVGLVLVFFAIYALKGFWNLQQTPGIALPEVLPEMANLPSFLLATAFALQVFLGMRSTVASIPQMKEPDKNVPRAFLISTVLLMTVYCSVVYVAVTMISPALSFLTLAANEIFTPINGALIGTVLIAVLGMLVCISGIGTSITVQSSLLSGMSRDGFLPEILSVTGPSGTRRIAIIVSSVFMIAFSFIQTVEFLAFAAVSFNILVFASVNLSVIGLRRRKPELRRPFKAPLYPLIPIIGIVASIGLFVSGFLTKEVTALDIPIIGGLLAIVFLSYYLKTLGLGRLKVAVGGVSLGLGTFGTLISYLVSSYSVWPFEDLWPRSSVVFMLIFISVISIIAGVLNIKSEIQETFAFHHSHTRKYLSHFAIAVGIITCLLALWSVLLSDQLFSLVDGVVFGVVGLTNILCGLLLLEK